jgi:hypothetical protein
MEVLRFTTVLKNWNRRLTEKSDNRPTMEFAILLLPLAITKSTSRSLGVSSPTIKCGRSKSHLDLGPGNPNIQFRVPLASLPLRCVFARSPACVCFFVFSLVFLRVLSVVFLFFAVHAERLVPCFCWFLFYSLVGFLFF